MISLFFLVSGVILWWAAKSAEPTLRQALRLYGSLFFGFLALVALFFPTVAAVAFGVSVALMIYPFIRS